MKAAERKLATVLFADLVGSTALGEQEDPERMRLLLERFYDAMAEEIARVGGTVEKFAGDAVMAVFGVPEAHEDHAERALHAAIGMQRRLEALEAIYHHAVEQGEPHLVTLMGDAGVGKTTVVRELSRWLVDQPRQPLQRTGRCLAYGHVTYRRDSPRAPWRPRAGLDRGGAAAPRRA